MSKIVLTVAFAEKDIVKALGAKWDSTNKYWYVPDGLSISPFIRWLPKNLKNIDVDNQSLDLEENTLLMFLSKIAQLIFRESRQSEWITAEISYLSRHSSGHYYLDLVQHNDQGIMIAKISAIIWKDIAINIDKKFSQIVNGGLKADIKVMILVKAKFDLIHGLKLVIEDIDPAYTIGDMAVKLKKIRNELIKQNIITSNKQVVLYHQFYNIAVVAPYDAAGLGDFKKEAELLQKYNLCEFKYYHANFQGKKAAKEIIEQIALAHKHHLETPYDMIVIIRGGGSVTDLAWLNDYDLAYCICKSVLPIICGIGHRKDSTILDEVSNRAFDTPSKVSTFIYNDVVSQAEDFIYQFTNILNTVNQNIMYHRTQLDVVLSSISSNAFSVSKVIYSDIGSVYGGISSHFFNCTKISGLTIRALFEQDILNYAFILLVENRRKIFNLINEFTYQSKKVVLDSEKKAALLINKVIGQDPIYILEKGFTIARDKDGNSLPSYELAKKCNEFILQFRDGKLLVSSVVEKNND